MTAGDGLVVAASTLAGAVPGWVLGGTAGALVGGAAGLIIGVIAAILNVRGIVTFSVVLGSVAGALIGRNIVRVLCLPGRCAGLEATSAILVGIGAFVGIGLVVALAARSFDEYHESVAANRAPPTTGCSPEEDPTTEP